MNALVIPSLDANAPTVRFIRTALDEHGATAVYELTPGDPAGDVHSIETRAAADAVGIIAGYSLGSHVGLRALLRKPHLNCDGLWFCPAPDAASRLDRRNIPPYLRPHMDYLAQHIDTFRPSDMVESLGRLSGRHLFIFGQQDDLRIEGELERIEALGLDHVRAIEVPGNHFLAESVVHEAVSQVIADMGAVS
jgi:pimeloyl-ACP methyl ester carboxylesterase